MKTTADRDRIRVIERIQGAAIRERPRSQVLSYSELRGNYQFEMRFPIVMMAIHLDMYEEAYIILSKMSDSSAVKQFVGNIVSVAFYNPYRARSSENDEMVSAGIGSIIMLHRDIPGKLIDLIYDVHKRLSPDTNLMSFDQIECDIRLWNAKGFCLYPGEWDDVDVQLEIASRIRYIHSCCPDMVRGMCEGLQGLTQRRSLYAIVCNGDPDRGRLRMKKYFRRMEMLYEVFEDSPKDLDEIAGTSRIIVSPMELYPVYVRDIKHFYGIMHKYVEKLVSAGQTVGVLENLMSWALDYDDGKTYGTVSRDVRMAIDEMLRVIGRDLKILSGDDPVRFIQEKYMDIEGDPICEARHKGRILIHYGGCKLIPDMNTQWGRSFMRRVFEAACRIECKTGGLIEVMEQIEEVKGTEDIEYIRENTPYPLGAEKLFKDIIDHIFTIGRSELLEVCLRKHLICPPAYDGLIKRASEENPDYLPCLYAYRAAFGNPE